MANVSVIKLKVRRGTDPQRQLITLDQGEIGYTTDSKRLFVGDGQTVGGIPTGMKYYRGSIAGATFNDGNISTAQTGDIVYDTDRLLFFTLTGSSNSYNNPSAYSPFGTFNVSYVNTNVSSATGLNVTGLLSATSITTQTLTGVTSITTQNLTASVITSSNGIYDVGAFSGPYTDGIVVDYVTGQGRISVGPQDNLSFFTGGPANTNTVTISTNGFTTVNNSISAKSNIYAGGNVFGGTNINVLNGTSYTIQLSDNGGTIASTNSTSGLTALVNSTGYPVGFQTAVIQLSTARVAVSGNGFSVNQSNLFYKTTKQYSAATLLYTGTIGGWVLFGDVSV